MAPKITPRFAPFALLVPALLAFATPADGPAFAPAEGTTLTKTFESSTDFVLDDMSLLISGQDILEMLGSFEVAVANESIVSMTDTYGPLTDGRLQKLERTFDTIEAITDFEIVSDVISESESTPASSDLEGLTVVFTWNEESGEYDVAYEEDEGDEELLEGLELDTDLRAFLPDGEVTEGDTWQVGVADLGFLIMPGGQLHQAAAGMEDVPELEEFEDLFAGMLDGFMDDIFEGGCQCEYMGTREVDGVNVAEIAVELEISSAVDLAEMILSVMDIFAEEAGDMMPELNIDTADLNLDFEGMGSLLWNVEAGLPHAFEIAGDSDIALDIAIDVDAEGASESIEAAVELSGTIAGTMTTGRN